MNLKPSAKSLLHPVSKNAPSLAFRNSILLSVILILFYSAFHKGFTPDTISDALLIWSDSFSMSGMLLLIITGARLLNRFGGVADWFGYTLYLARFLLMREKDQSYTNFHDYCLLKERSTSPLWPWIITGCVLFAVGCILSYLYVFM